MKTNAAAYWIALGVLALGLNSEYRQGQFVTAHRIAERTASTLCRITTRAEKTLAVAMGSTGHQGLTVDPFVPFTNEAETVREHSKLMRELARNKAEFLREEIRTQADEIRVQADVAREGGADWLAIEHQVSFCWQSKLGGSLSEDRRAGRRRADRRQARHSGIGVRDGFSECCG